MAVQAGPSRYCVLPKMKHLNFTRSLRSQRIKTPTPSVNENKRRNNELTTSGRSVTERMVGEEIHPLRCIGSLRVPTIRVLTIEDEVRLRLAGCAADAGSCGSQHDISAAQCSSRPSKMGQRSRPAGPILQPPQLRNIFELTPCRPAPPVSRFSLRNRLPNPTQLERAQLERVQLELVQLERVQLE